MGHVYMICLVVIIQTLVYREISVLFRSTNDPWSNTLNWYFFAVANYFLYGETIIYYFKVGQKLLLPIPYSIFLISMSSSRTLCSCHLQRIIGSSALCSTCSVRSTEDGILPIAHIFSGFMGFVGSLKKNYLRRQFSLFGWVHMTLLVIVLSSHFIVDNILEVRIHRLSHLARHR